MALIYMIETLEIAEKFPSGNGSRARALSVFASLNENIKPSATIERSWPRECPKMYLTSEIVKDTLAARRFRLLAPLAVLLALAALTLAPAIIG